MTATDFAMNTPEGNAAVADIMAALPAPTTWAEVYDDMITVELVVVDAHPEVTDTAAREAIFTELKRRKTAATVTTVRLTVAEDDEQF